MAKIDNPIKDNSSLSASKNAKKDEFYTLLSTIEEELRHYRKHFKDKVVLCNCDDPFESNFFKYFALNFNYLGLKKLIATCYVDSPVAGSQMTLFDLGTNEEITKKPHRITITEVDDVNGDGAFDIADVEWLLKNDSNVLTQLEGNGDFRSQECRELMKEADIVVTNPPFSLFREYVAQLVEMGKQFLIIGNQNAITYKEIFPLLKDNKVWLGYHSGHTLFAVPETYEIPEHLGTDRARVRGAGYKVDENGRLWRDLGNICWFTNLDHTKRHEQLDLFKLYDPEKYPHYDNYDAIEVSKVAEIPDDYEECYLVPIKYKQDLIDAGYDVGYERLNSKGEPCITLSLSLSLSLSAGDCSAGADGVLQRRNGCPDNVSGQVQPESISSNRRGLHARRGNNSGWESKAQSSKNVCKWEEALCAYLDSPSELEWCSGVMGVPITFLDKFNPKQFEILGETSGRADYGKDAWPVKRYINPVQHDPQGNTSNGGKVNTGAQLLSSKPPAKGIWYTADNVDGYLIRVYKRILIRRKNEKTRLGA